MSSNLPDPSKIPDMSLGERDDKPAPPARDVSSSYQPKPADTPALPTPSAAPQDEPHWREGDRVLAPWEPMFLYAGTIKQIKLDDAKGDQALIEFDDGDDGWVFLYSIGPLEVKEGQKVLSRRNMGPHFYPGKVLEVAGEEVRVGFDGGGSEWTTIAALRIPCIENGPGALGTKFGSNRPPEMMQQVGGGVPSWVIWVGIGLLLAVVRIGCRSM